MYFGTALSLNKNYYSKTYGFSVRLIKDYWYQTQVH
jgi:hypothetical protein